MAMPRGGRPLVTLNWIPASRRRNTASAARFVNTFSCVTSVPSTSAISMRIGFAERPLVESILNSFLVFCFLALSNSCRFRLLLLVVPQKAAVDEKCGSRDVVGFVRGQETGQPGDVFRFPQPAKRDVFEEIFELYRIVQKLCIDGRFDGPGSDGVDGDPARSELDCQVSRQHLEPALACAIGGKMRERQFFMHRADVDDFSGASGLAKVTHCSLRHKEHALQVDVQNGVEIVFRHIPEVGSFLETGIVHKDVDLAESRDGVVNESLPFRNLPYICLKGYCALLGCRADTRSHFVRPSFVLAIADRDVGAFAGQSLRDRPANPLIPARYGGHLASQSIWQHSSSWFLFVQKGSQSELFFTY